MSTVAWIAVIWALAIVLALGFAVALFSRGHGSNEKRDR